MDSSIAVPHGLTLRTDVAATEWVDESLLPLRGLTQGVRVGEIVPTGFEAYARILHPASRRVGDRFEPITWSELARTRGKTIHPEVQLKALLGDEFRHSARWVSCPKRARFPEGLRAPLVEILLASRGAPVDAGSASGKDTGRGSVATNTRTRPGGRCVCVRGPCVALRGTQPPALRGTPPP